MNVLWINADQMRADCSGFIGHPIVRTPNLDALASRSTVFENAFAQAAICTPSRVCYFTSRYVHAHGAWWNGVPMSADHPLLPQVLQYAGYRTALIGKLHFNPQHLAFGFDRKEGHEEHLPKELSAYARFLEEHCAQGPSEATVWDSGHPRRASVGICHMPEELEETRWVADRSCAFLEEQGDQRFFLFSSFIRPHSPYNPLPRFAAMYDDLEIDPPPFDRAELDQLPPRIRAQFESFDWQVLGPDDYAAMRRRYYALCTQVDESVGRILGCLAAQGLAESTIVVFCADHGDFVGEHGEIGKMHLWDGSLHVPLVIYDPRRGSTPSRYAGLVETIDLMPTLLELLDVPTPETLQGISLLPVMDDPRRPHRNAVFAEFAYYTVTQGVRQVLAACRDPNSVSVRTERWKYIHYSGEDGELYDVQADPGERRNFFRDPELLPVRQEMIERLLDWRIRMDSNGLSKPQPGNSYFRSYFA